MTSSTFILNEIADDDKKSVSVSVSKRNLQAYISPMVVMSILNHFQRRPSNKQRQGTNPVNQPKYPPYVIGLLFGQKDNDTHTLIINDAFGLEIQMNPVSNQVALELSVAKEALALHAMAHPTDRFIGWYRTGLEMEASSTSIHDMIIIKQLAVLSNKVSRKAGPELDESEYVHLLVDTELRNDKITVKAYTTVPVVDPLQKQQYNDYLKEKKRRERLAKQKKNNPNKPTKSRKKKRRKKAVQTQPNADNTEEKPAQSKPQTQPSQPSPPKKQMELEPLAEVEKPLATFYRFKEIKSEYHVSESEGIGLDMIIQSVPEGTSLDSPAMLMNDTNHLETVLQSFLQNLEHVEQYVHRVINGEINGNEKLGWLIGDALSSVPHLSAQQFEEMMSNRLQDFLMMAFLGKMTQAQLIIADKINKVLPSTVPGFEVEGDKE